MRINLNHPMLAGCKFLLIPDGSGTLRNAFGGPEGTVANAPALTFLGPHPALTLVQGSSQAVTFGNPSTYGFGGPDITVVARVKPATLGTTNSETAAVSAATAAANSGYLLMFSNFGGSEVGWCFVVYKGGSFLLANDGTNDSTVGRERVVAGVYESRIKEARVYLDGVFGSSQADGGQDWDVVPANPILVGKFNSPSIYGDGDYGWVAIFDRVLTDGEIAVFSRDWEWPFFNDEGGEIMLPTNVVTYFSVDAVDQAYTVLAPVTYTSLEDALGVFGGDVTTIPETGVATYTSVDEAVGRYIGDVPTLVFYATVDGDISTLSANSPVLYTTVDAIHQSYTGLVDGRRDLFDTGRYRR